jgi:hypothetical protein
VRLRRYPILFAALAVVVLVGLLQGRSHRAAAAEVAYAATRTLDAGSSRVEVTYQLPSSISSAPLFPFAITGLIDYRNHRGEIAFGSTGQRIVYDGDVVYERVGAELSADKPWVRLPTGNDFGASDVLDLQGRAMFDPIHLLAFLRRTSSGVRELGSDTVRGFRTTHYEGVLDLQKIVDQAPADQRQELQEELDFLTQDQPKTISYGIWVDGNDVARRLRIDEAEGAAITIEFYDFGVPVVLDLPREDQVMTAEEYWDAVDKYTREHASDCEGDSTAPPASTSEGSGRVTVVLCEASTLAGDDGSTEPTDEGD